MSWQSLLGRLRLSAALSISKKFSGARRQILPSPQLQPSQNQPLERTNDRSLPERATFARNGSARREIFLPEDRHLLHRRRRNTEPHLFRRFFRQSSKSFPFSAAA